MIAKNQFEEFVKLTFFEESYNSIGPRFLAHGRDHRKCVIL